VGDPTCANSPPLEAVRLQLERILASQAFRKAGRLSRLLQYLVEETICGRGDQLKEYSVGLEVFGRGESFDPRTDSVVRVEVSRLRVKLQAYYASEGGGDPVLIDLPKGSYLPVLALRGASDQPPAAPAWGRRVALAGILLVLVAGATYGVLSLLRTRDSGPASVAVLPFQNLSSDQQYDYINQGLGEEVTIALSKVEGLRVLAPGSTAEFAGSARDWPAIGRKLGVSSVLDGSLRKAGERLRIVVELVSAADGQLLWGEVFEGDPTHGFGAQDRIVAGVAQALRIRPAKRPKETAAARDPEAQLLFWRGRYFRNQLSPGGVLKSVGFLEQAIRKDPTYAPAYATLADACGTLAFHGLAPLSEVMPKAKAAVEKALALDTSLAEAHGALAWMKFFYDWDWPGAEREFARALELNPSYGPGLQRHAFALVSRGRFDQAIAESRRALGLDPLAFVASNDLGMLLYMSGRYEEAIRQARVTLEMRHDVAAAHVLLGSCFAMQRKLPEAIAEFRAARGQSELQVGAPGRLGYAYALAGQRGEARRLLSELKSRAERGEQTCTQMAFIHAGLGEADQAIECLREAYARREGEAVFLGVEPMLQSLHAEPRWRAFTQKLGL
jgi:TolB-like protein/tetratricopeptide (TPR) repeat protein